MAIDPLATAADLTARNITVPDGMDADTVLQSATDSVRDAAGCPITVATSTVTLVADDWRELDLPGGPVSSVASVEVGGEAFTDYRKIDSTLYASRPWSYCLPVEVTVTYTHGYPIVPTDIVDLVCAMAAMAFKADGDYGSTGQLQSLKLGEYSETYTHVRGSESASPVAIPDTVRDRLRVRFGTTVAVVGSRR